MNIRYLATTACISTLFAAPLYSHAGVVFSFQEVGNNVVMTSSGTIDTSKLTNAGSVYTWGNAGIEENGNHDIIGGTTVGQVNVSFGFSTGTDFSAWASASGPWGTSDFGVDTITGTKGFTTYVRNASNQQIPGLGVELADVVAGLWTPDQTWTWTNDSFANLQMNAGTYTVTDLRSGEFITFQVGAANNAVPEPSTLLLAGLALAGLGVRLRRKTA